MSECIECPPGPKEVSFREVAVSGSSTCNMYLYLVLLLMHAHCWSRDIHYLGSPFAISKLLRLLLAICLLSCLAKFLSS